VRESKEEYGAEEMKKRGFDVRITTCYDCPYKEYGLRKCGITGQWFEYFEIEKGIINWCPKIGSD
jgi:hypothetical protein